MAEHPNVARIKDAYAAFAKGDLAVLEDFFAEGVLGHEGGRNQIAGEYRGREAVFGLFGKLAEVTEGSLRIDLHAVFADDEHGVALVLVEHDLDLVLGLSDVVNVLDFGIMIATGSPAEVRADPRVRAAYIGEEEAAS